MADCFLRASTAARSDRNRGLQPHLGRTLLGLLGLLGGLAMPIAVNAQEYPSRPIRLVVPFAAGGNTDILARLIAKDMATIWGQPFIVENKPGAGAAIGTSYVVKAPADGYTILLTTSNITFDQTLRPTLPYKAEVDLVPITKFVSAPIVLMVNPSVKANSVRELVEFGKANPKTLFYITYGVGASNHMMGELFKLQTGIPMDPVPFKSMAEALPAFSDNQVHASFELLMQGIPLSKSGKARILAIASRDRDPNAPSVPTMTESGFPEFDASLWFGLFAPRGTPQAIVSKFHAGIVQILAQPDVQKRLRDMSLQAGGNSPADFAAEVAKEQAKWRNVITRAGIQIKE